MKIGLATLFGWRPHVEHMAFLAHILREAGHELSFLTCDAALPNCHNREFRRQPGFLTCATCVVGGLRSFESGPFRSIDRYRSADLPAAFASELAASSANTIARIETSQEASEERARIRRRLSRGIDIVYQNVVDWIRADRLDGIVVFNGRMDVTRAVTAASEMMAVPFVTMERKEDGILLIPNANCLSLAANHRLHEQFSGKALAKSQVERAARAGLARVLQSGVKEWRVYNRGAQPTDWPAPGKGSPRVLILPSSKNEFEGHEEWRTEWDDYTQPIDHLLEMLGIDRASCVLRCHPNWGEPIGKTQRAASEMHYTRWARARGIYVISSQDKRSTQDLMKRAEVVVVNGSSAAIEAGMLGKRIFCIGHSRYERAGFATHIVGSGDWRAVCDAPNTLPREIVRQTLRWIYTDQCRITQYSQYVRARSTFEFDYYSGGSAETLTRMFTTGKLEAGDPAYAEDTMSEDRVLDLLTEGEWEALLSPVPTEPAGEPLIIQRHRGLRWLDRVRPALPRGDR